MLANPRPIGALLLVRGAANTGSGRRILTTGNPEATQLRTLCALVAIRMRKLHKGAHWRTAEVHREAFGAFKKVTTARKAPPVYKS